jgi:hypothetical protein
MFLRGKITMETDLDAQGIAGGFEHHRMNPRGRQPARETGNTHMSRLRAGVNIARQPGAVLGVFLAEAG